MTTDEKIKLISRFTEEIMTPEDLRFLLEQNQPLNHYIGFELSGKIHLGSMLCLQKIKDFTEAGIKCNILLADWHTWINDKLSGDKEIIKKIGVEYFKEGFLKLYECLGGNPKDLNFVIGSELYDKNNKYWETVIDVSKHTSLARMRRSIAIMGRKEGESIDFAKLIYPPMQVADIFIQQIHLPHAGLDQRKAQVIARDVANKLKYSPLMLNGKKIKPVAIHHHLILGLKKPSIWPIDQSTNKQEIWSSMKMSKSDPASAVFINDSEEEIRSKINKAFCPEKEIEFNPIIDWTEYLIFSREESITIKRDEKFGGNLTIHNSDELKELFNSGKLHPADLKQFVADYLIDFLAPIRAHFSKGKPKEIFEELKKLLPQIKK